MRMQNANQIQQAIRKLGEKRIPLTRIYRSLYSEDMFLTAYSKIYANRGALTPGVDDDTADGMSIDRIRRIIDQLRYERYRFRPVRRTYVDKKDGRKRPLGLPNFTDKLVQEVIRMILEAYYEPRFRSSSHGFRPDLGCHTALTDVQRRFRAATWFIEGDIRGCFDNIDHDILMSILGRDIQDNRFLNLIRMGLEAGMMEDWVWKPTYSGVPQGGIISPILSNIYLHELDVFVEDVLIPQYTNGEKRSRNPVYRHYEHLIYKAKKQDDGEAVRHYQRLQQQHPSVDVNDPDFRRLRYVRYADDFILAFTGSKSEARTIKAALADFLKNALHLELSDEKTLITHARSEHAQFLGYAVSIYHAEHRMTRRSDTNRQARSANGRVRLGVPYGLMDEYIKPYTYRGKSTSELKLLPFSDAHIIDIYQARFRGIAEYYKFAVDHHRLSKLKNAMQAALVKTLAHKYKRTVSKTYRKYRSTRVVDGRTYRTLEVTVPTSNGERTIYWGAIPLRTVKPSHKIVLSDVPPREIYQIRSDLITRLQADACELCGSTEKCQVHHIRKLADLKKRWAGRREKPAWVTAMITMRRKTLVVCHKCHVDIHAGRPTPNKREIQDWRAG